MEQYQLFIEEIKQNIDATFPNIEYEIIYHISKNVYYLDIKEPINSGIMRMTILPNNTWEEIKKHIEVKLTPISEEICERCNKQNIGRLTCTKCSNYLCIYCYMICFKRTKGFVICPSCNFTYGHKCSRRQIEQGLIEIKEKMGII